MYKLFYYPRNASWAPHMLLNELEVDHELVLVDRKAEAQKSLEYLALNPTGRIPTLADGDLVLFESAAICMHLCESHASRELTPTQSTERAQFFQWLFYLTSTVQPELMLYFYPEKHVEINSKESVIERQEQRVTEMLGLLDKQLSIYDYIAGNKLTACDFILFMLSHWASNFHTAPLSFQHLGAHLRKLAKRTSVTKTCRIEGTCLEAYR